MHSKIMKLYLFYSHDMNINQEIKVLDILELYAKDCLIEFDIIEDFVLIGRLSSLNIIIILALLHNSCVCIFELNLAWEYNINPWANGF